MSAKPPSNTPLRIIVLLLLLCLPAVGFIAFSRGEKRGIKKAQVNSANDSAFYCLSGVRAINGEEKFKLALQICLDGEAIRLSELCIAHPEWIGRTNYNLLRTIHRYLVEHQGEREGSTSLRPVSQVSSKISQAMATLERLHDVRKWKDE